MKSNIMKLLEEEKLVGNNSNYLETKVDSALTISANRLEDEAPVEPTSPRPVPTSDDETGSIRPPKSSKRRREPAPAEEPEVAKIPKQEIPNTDVSLYSDQIFSKIQIKKYSLSGLWLTRFLLTNTVGDPFFI